MLPTKKTQNWLPSIFNDFLGNEWISKGNSTAPAMNIIENDREYRVELAAPGLKKDDFSLKINDQSHLVVSIRKSESKEEKDSGEKFLRREFSYSHFQQNLILPENVVKDSISATLENGLFTITIPKKEQETNSDEKIIPIG